MKIKWYWKAEAWIKTIWLILVYGLEGAENKINAELKEVKRHLSNTSSQTAKGGG